MQSRPKQHKAPHSRYNADHTICPLHTCCLHGAFLISGTKIPGFGVTSPVLCSPLSPGVPCPHEDCKQATRAFNCSGCRPLRPRNMPKCSVAQFSCLSLVSWFARTCHSSRLGGSAYINERTQRLIRQAIPAKMQVPSRIHRARTSIAELQS